MIVSQTNFNDETVIAWWNEIYQSEALVCNTLFQSAAWNILWYEHFVRDDARRELHLLKIMQGDKIVALAPLFLQTRNAGPLTVWRYLMFLGDRLAQYTDLITAESDTFPLWSALGQYLKAELPDAWIELHDVLPGATAQQSALEAEKVPGEVYLRIPLAGLNSDNLPDRCVPHMRREITRGRKAFTTDASWVWEAVASPGTELVQSLMELNHRRFGDVSWFADENHRDYFSHLCCESGEEVSFSVLRHGDDIAHIMVSYVHGSSMLYVLSGMDERFGKYSPGSMNLDHSISYAADHGFEYFDFLRGEEAYKREFQPEERMSEHWTLQSAAPGLRYRLARAAQDLRRGREQEAHT